MYKGSADWSLIREVKNNPRIKIPIFGNGDIDSPQKALDYKNEYGVDGIMIGRASIGYPWIFREVKHFLKTGQMLPPPDLSERVKAAREHLEFSVRWKGTIVGIFEMRMHYTNYFRGIPHFKEYRTKLVTSSDLNELYELLDAIPQKFEMPLV
jgi:tRNA-dihydrouridine synthase